MSIARKFKRQAARSQPKPAEQEEEVTGDAEAAETPKTTKPTPPTASFNQFQKPIHPSSVSHTQAMRRGTMRGK